MYELFLDLDADEHADRVPDRLRERARRARRPRARRARADLEPLFETLLETIPAPSYDPEHPLQALVTNLDASPYVGRLALLRIHHGTLRKGAQIAWCRADGTIENARVTELYITEALDRVPADEAGPGEIVALAGLPEVTIGETIADPDDPRPLPVTTVDEPSLSVTIGINTSPLAGTEGDAADREPGQGPARRGARRQRLAARAPDDAAGRLGGAGPRRAAARDPRRAHAPRGLRAHGRQAGGADEARSTASGTSRSSASRSTSPRSTSASSRSCSRCARAGCSRWSTTAPAGRAWSTSSPRAALIGFRTEFLTETRGTGILHHVFEAWEPWHGELRTRPTGSLVADRRGQATGFAITNLQERGSLFIAPGRRALRGHGRRRERARQRPRRQRRRSRRS